MNPQLRELFIKAANSNAADLSPEGTILAAFGALLEDRCDFLGDQKAFQYKYHQIYDGPPRPIDASLKWRVDFLGEEMMKELNEAVEAGDLVKQIDALIDSLVVIYGTLYLMGVPVPPFWAEVLRSNMTKEYQPGKGKFGMGVVKGKNFQPPDIKGVLERIQQQYEQRNKS